MASIEDGFIDEAAVTMFPNPAIDEFTIDLKEFDYRNVNVMIFIKSGFCIYEKTEIRASSQSVKTHNYSQGVYIISIKSEIDFVRKKWVIIK
ncbi:MAG: hypothetical protein ACI905_001782 [Roseivirga sp.]